MAELFRVIRKHIGVISLIFTDPSLDYITESLPSLNWDGICLVPKKFPPFAGNRKISIFKNLKRFLGQLLFYYRGKFSFSSFL